MAKRAEHKHLVQTGQDGIAAALDPDFVQAVREMDEFEGLVEPRKRELELESGAEDEVPQIEEQGGKKKARIEPPPPTALTSPPSPPPPESNSTQSTGILSANAIDSLKFLASLHNQPGGATPLVQSAPKSAPPPAVTTGLGGLADYGSDSDDE